MELGCKQRSRAACASCRAFVVVSRVCVGSEVSSSQGPITPWPELAATTDPTPVTPGLRSPGFCVFALLALPTLLKWLSKLQLRRERKIYRSPDCVPAALFCAPEVRRWRVSCASGNDESDRSANANGNRVIPHVAMSETSKVAESRVRLAPRRQPRSPRALVKARTRSQRHDPRRSKRMTTAETRNVRRKCRRRVRKHVARALSPPPATSTK
jgi:hypothetical protein